MTQTRTRQTLIVIIFLHEKLFKFHFLDASQTIIATAIIIEYRSGM